MIAAEMLSLCDVHMQNKWCVCTKYQSPSQERQCQQELQLSDHQRPPQLTHPKQPQGSSSPTGEI